MIAPEDQRKLIPLKEIVAKNFAPENWLELGALTGSVEFVQNHGRLLRSLSWGDPDYSGHVLDVLLNIAARDADNLARIENYVISKFKEPGRSISSEDNATSRRVYFTPSAFSVPESSLDINLISVMMPFSQNLEPVYQVVRLIAGRNSMKCQRVDDIWENSTIIQDIFELIWRSFIVVCDFAGKNANVFYEAGIAHTLGKHVIPIAQSDQDVPFDLKQHRYINYLNNAEGREALGTKIEERIRYLKSR